MSLRLAFLRAVGVASLVIGGLAAPTGAHAEVQAALPAVCTQPSPPTNVYTWVGGKANHDWENSANWQHAAPPPPPPGEMQTRHGFPQDDHNHDGNPDRNDTIVCIPDLAHADFVFINGTGGQTGFVWIAELYVEGDFEIQLQANNSGLLIDGANPSSLGPDTSIDLRGTFGGRATVHSAGDITATSYFGDCPPNTVGPPPCSFPVQLTSHMIGRGAEIDYGDAPDETAGRLVIDTGGTLTFTDRGAGLGYDYQLEIAGTTTLGPNPDPAPAPDPARTPYLAASDGTEVDIDLGGKLTFAGKGGLYQGMDFPSEPQAPVSNSGTIEKTGANTVSLVDLDYQPQPSGAVDVVSGDLRLPGSTTVSAPRTANVTSANTFGTGTCGGVSVNPQGSAPACTVTADPTKDEVSVAMTAPSGQDLTGVTVDEAPPSSDVLFEHPAPVVRVDADDFQIAEVHVTPVRANPAQAEIRYAKSFFTAGIDLGDLDVVRSPLATNARTVLHDCTTPGVVNDGEQACVDRGASVAATAAAPGYFVFVVNTIDTTDSRYIIRLDGTDVEVRANFSGDVQVGHAVNVILGFDPQPDTAQTSWTVDNVTIPGV